MTPVVKSADAVNGPAGTWDFDPVLDALMAANSDLASGSHVRLGRHVLPSRAALESIIADLRAVLFPLHFGPRDLTARRARSYVGERLDAVLLELQEQVLRGLLFAATPDEADDGTHERRALAVTRELAFRLPAIRAQLGSDAQAAYRGDPAATSADEAVFCYPGITAITHHRIAHELYHLGVPLIARIIAEIAHSATGIDIHPGAQIGGSFFIDHGTGVVIGETSVIGERVRIYQGVTLGARSFPTDNHGHAIKGRPRHPVVEDDVTIYAGATILGRITIGRGSSIGGNVWLTRSVPPGSSISQAQVREDLFDAGAGI